MLKHNNLKFLFYLFLFFNILYTFVFYFSGYIGGDLISSNIASDPWYLSTALAIFLFSFYFLLVFFWNILNRIKLRLGLSKIHEDNHYFDCVFLGFSIFLNLHYSIFGGGVGATIQNGNALFSHYFLAVFTPQWLLPIYLFYRMPEASKIYWITLVFYVSASLLSGLTSSLILLFFIYLTYQVNIKNSFNLLRNVIYLAVGIIIYPFFRIFKSLIIQRNIASGEVDVSQLQIIRALSDDGFISVYFETLITSFQRLQIVSSYHYILQNIRALRHLFENNDGIYFYETPWVYQMFVRRLGWDEVGENTFQNIIALSINGRETWQSQAGFLGHVLLDPYMSGLFLSVSLLLLFLFYFFSKLVDRNGVLHHYVWFFILMYVVHGWFFASIEFLRACINFLIIVLIFNFFRSKKYSSRRQ